MGEAEATTLAEQLWQWTQGRSQLQASLCKNASIIAVCMTVRTTTIMSEWDFC